jgi:hypothetical protein
MMYSANKKAEGKANKYADLCHRAGYKFLPFCAKIFGSMTETSIKLTSAPWSDEQQTDLTFPIPFFCHTGSRDFP